MVPGGWSMETEKSLLQKIREKELEVSVKIDKERNQADQVLDQASREASAILNREETEGEKEAGEFLQGEMKRLNAEAELLRAERLHVITALRDRGGKNLPEAVEKIVSLVLPD
jgi:vacuolar-type H+-ATPase subunit H